jgi:hypothetical protein
MLFMFGGLLRLAPVFVLGRRFSGLVAIRADTIGSWPIVRTRRLVPYL